MAFPLGSDVASLMTADQIPHDYKLTKQAWDESHKVVKLHFPDISVPEVHAGAAHIFSRHWEAHMADYLDMTDINSPNNALILMKPIKVCTSSEL